MSISNYVDDLRKKVGNDLLLIPGVAAIIRDSSGCILLQRTKNGMWNLPAGAIDPGEKPAQAMVREVFEETGLRIRPMVVRGAVGGQPEYRMTYPNGDVIESTTIIFECKVVGGALHPQDDETARLQYFAPDAMPKLATPCPPQLFLDLPTQTFFEWDDDWLSELNK